ncbi:hypothetical protein HK105_205537 [Polyrhizophydium stewartii]|uniref:SH3 domain-containing protein n=1 Tax=Polyrhizophydium stewartii TaxID=2732419 RepID=A0ABR4N636_9FUNG
MVAIKHCDIIPSIDPTLSSTDFVVEAGWGSPASIVGVIRLATSKPLKDAKLILEFQGVAETFWVGAKVRKPGDPPGEAFARRFQLVTSIVRDSKEALEPNEFGSITLPFTIHLPAQGLPPSFDDSRGCIKYSLKSTLTWTETFQLLKPTHVTTVPITVVMPRSHRLKLLSTPSPLNYNTPPDPDKCTCAIRLPGRVYIPGQQFTVQFAIPYVPPNRTVAAIQASIEACTTYRSVTSDATKRNRNAVVWNPFALASAREVPAPGELTPESPVFSRTIQLVTDPKYHQPSIESSLISTRSVVKFQVFLDNEDEPHMAFETAIVVIPADTIKETAALHALELAREQLRPANEIAGANPNNSSLRSRSKTGSFSTTASIRTPLSTSHSDDASYMPAYATSASGNAVSGGGSSPRVGTPDGFMGQRRGTSPSLAAADLPPRYSVSQRSYEGQPQHPQHQQHQHVMMMAGGSASHLATEPPMTPVSSSSASLRSSAGDQGRRPSVVGGLAPVPENQAATFQDNAAAAAAAAAALAAAAAYDDESDDELDGLLSIDELADRLADAQLSRKDVDMAFPPQQQARPAQVAASPRRSPAFTRPPAAQPPRSADAAPLSGSTSGSAVVSDLLARLDSGGTQMQPQPGQPPVSQLGLGIAAAQASIDTPPRSAHADHEISQLENLLASLDDVSHSLSQPIDYAGSGNPVHGDYVASPITPASVGSGATKSSQIKQIDDLLESLLAFEQDHATAQAAHSPKPLPLKSMSPPPPRSPNIQLPMRSTSTTGEPPLVYYPYQPQQLQQLQQHPGAYGSPQPIPHQGQQHYANGGISHSPLSSSYTQQQQQQAGLYRRDSQSSGGSRPLSSDTSSRPSMNATGGKPKKTKKTKAIARFCVVAKHVPQRNDELELVVGEMVCIREIFKDGWCWGYNIETKQEGSFPMKKVQLYDSVTKI